MAMEWKRKRLSIRTIRTQEAWQAFRYEKKRRIAKWTDKWTQRKQKGRLVDRRRESGTLWQMKVRKQKTTETILIKRKDIFGDGYSEVFQK
jgi:hypothetical protein